MTAANAVLVVMWIGMTAYALFGGADFGAGIWDLLAGGAQRGRRQRDFIEHSLAPVWEANHVWLIFVLVVLWTAFPKGFAAVASTLYIPLTLAALGMIARGAAFAFRKSIEGPSVQRLFGAAFAFSSLVTPFFLGTIAGGVASGRVPPGIAQGDVIKSWINPTSLLGGVLAVCACAHLAATFLCADAAREGDLGLCEQFRVRALGSGGASGIVALAGVPLLRSDAPQLFHGLTHRGLALILVSGIAGIVTMGLLRGKRYVLARLAAALAVAAVVWGWAAAQYPYLLQPDLSISQAAAGDQTLHALLLVLVAGSILLVPALLFMYRLFQIPLHGSEPASGANASTAVAGRDPRGRH